MKHLFYLFLMLIPVGAANGQESSVYYLSGKGTDDQAVWDFYCTKGRNSGEWSKIGVPSNWEFQGFGNFNYGHDENKSDETGIYRMNFYGNENWKNKSVKVVFVGSMTDTEVWINDKLAGPVHQGGFYQFEYEISDKIKIGKENTLQVRVSKMSANASVNMAERKADYWVFGGIYRPVYLKISPREHIHRVEMNAKADGNFYSRLFLENVKGAGIVKLKIVDTNGELIGKEIICTFENGDSGLEMTSQYSGISAWNPESPTLYTAQFELYKGDNLIHIHKEKFGFRTVEIRPRDGIYVNGKKIMFKGVNRHSAWPESGRALSKKLNIMDVELIKEMNMNAVRMSHYPPDPDFLDACDSLGLFVLDELAGWQRPPYDTEIGKKLVKEMVTRDVNHPSIVLWDNGNEGGWNNDLNEEFSKYDPQNRKVIHPWELYNDMDTKHYRDWNYGTGTFFNGRDIFFPTEFLHGLYDGGHGAGLEDWWNLMLGNPLSAGGFLWSFADEGIKRDDLDGRIDTYTNNAPDGILGPYREKEGSYYSIREIWSPVYIPWNHIPPGFTGEIPVENRFIYTSLEQCSFKAAWIWTEDFPQMDTIYTGAAPVEEILPGNRGILKLQFPSKAIGMKSLFLMLKAFDPHGKEIMNWQWPLSTPEKFCYDLTVNHDLKAVKAEEDMDKIMLTSKKTQIYISKKSGMIDSVCVDGKNAGLNNGPCLVHGEQVLKEINLSRRGGSVIAEAKFEKGFYYIRYELMPNNWLRIEYEEKINGKFNNAGISFDFPESNIREVDLLADGPYRVWKNRMKGPQFGLWNKKYNNTITGESWEYPEFKGYYSNFYWAHFICNNQDIYCATSTENIFLRLFTPGAPQGAYNSNTTPEFPVGDISFLYGISPIGTKFKPAENHGPMGQLNDLSLWQDDKARRMEIFFRFE